MVNEVGRVMGKIPFVHLGSFLSGSPPRVSTPGPYYNMSLFIVGL